MFDVGDIEHEVITSIEQALDVNSVSIVIHSHGNESIVEVFSKLKSNGEIFINTVNLKKSIVSECLNSGKSILIENLLENPYYNYSIDGLVDEDANSLLCVPIVIEDVVIGSIVCRRVERTGFSINDKRQLEAIAVLVSNLLAKKLKVKQLAISNANLIANRWEVQRSRDVLRTLFDNLPIKMYIIDENWEIIAANMEISDDMHYAPREIVGKRCYSALYDLQQPCPHCKVIETFLTGQPNERTSQFWGDNGIYNEHKINVYPILNEENAVSQVIIMDEDITEQRQMESRLAQSEKLAAIGQLVAGLAHEINNPMAAIIANAQILRQDMPQDDDLLLEAVDLIILAGERANRVLHNLLDLSRQDQYQFSPANLNDSIEKAIALLQYETTIRSVDVKLALDYTIPEIMVDQEELQGVWINMLLNAMDSISHNHGEITVSSFQKDGYIVIAFEDNGQGISKDIQAHIFDPFFTTKGPNEGTGLGLSVCHKTIERHGGYIDVESQIGKGTRFNIYFPA